MKKITALLLAFFLLFLCGCTEVLPTDIAEEKSFSASELIRNAYLWNGSYMFDDEFKFVIEYFDMKAVEAGLGTNYNELGGDFIHNSNSIGEWGYQLMQYVGGLRDGVNSPGCDSVSDKGPSFFDEPAPATRIEAYNRVIKIISEFIDEKYTAMNGHYTWQHYAGEAGYKALGQELGENVNAYQYKIAMLRGAAKEYGTPWFVDYSFWYYGTVPNYVKGEENINGHSENLMERTLLMAFMAGADATIAEAGELKIFYPDDTLTPYGEVIKKVHDFTKKLTERGTVYTPFALLIDKYYGMNSGNNGSFDTFKAGAPEDYTFSVLNDFIWESSFDSAIYNERNVLVNSKYGDLFDGIFIDSPDELLETYPVIILMGNVDYYTEAEVKKLADYVKNGGVLVLNTAYAKYLTGFPVEIPSKLNGEIYKEIELGKGSVFVFGKGCSESVAFDDDGNMYWRTPDDWKIDGLSDILDELYKRYVPLTFSESVEHIISVKDGSLVVYLANNDGMSKTAGVRKIYDDTGEIVDFEYYVDPLEVDSTKTKDLVIEYTGEYTLHSAEDIYNSHEVKLDENKISLHLDPGDIAVVEMKIGKQN